MLGACNGCAQQNVAPHRTVEDKIAEIARSGTPMPPNESPVVPVVRDWDATDHGFASEFNQTDQQRVWVRNVENNATITQTCLGFYS
jgi:hypothetical protein